MRYSDGIQKNSNIFALDPAATSNRIFVAAYHHLKEGLNPYAKQTQEADIYQLAFFSLSVKQKSPYSLEDVVVPWQHLRRKMKCIAKRRSCWRHESA